ncbi:MAG: hypothetical protein JXR77_03070 [Lentisphaeria bacterium]|nr:hypothetical protein [Lentisphaeria bacterium]
MKRRLWVRVVVAVCAASLWSMHGVWAQESGEESAISVEASVDWVTDYVWRGMLLTNNPVIQPSVTLSGYGLSLNVWGSIDVTDVNEDKGEYYHLQELDYTISYGYTPMEGIDLEVGLIWYTFSGFDSTGEVYGSVTFPCVLLSPSLTAFYDFDEAEGWYVNAGVEHGFDITEKLNLTLSGGIGWGGEDYHGFYFGGQADHAAVSDVLVMATLSYAVTDTVSVSVYGAFSDLLDSDVNDAAKAAYGDSDIFFGGVSLGVSF